MNGMARDAEHGEDMNGMARDAEHGEEALGMANKKKKETKS